MKKNLFYTISLFGLTSLLLTSCLKDEDPVHKEDPVIANNKYVNNWLYDDVMSLYYLWNDKIPSGLDEKINPDAYFNSMLYKYDKNLAPDGDRFSWIQENYVELLESLSGVVHNELGFDYKWYGYNQNLVFGEFAFIKKNTDAAARGLRRGQVFTHVNNVQITMDNYSTILSDAASNASIALRVYDVELDIDAALIDFKNRKDIAINLLSRYAEDPVYLDTVYTINGKTIGYLVYNFFAADAGDETGSYDLALNRVFDRFRNRGVDNLILDLRYNSGGRITSAIHLSSMIVKDLSTNNVFSRMEYNREYNNWLINRYGADYLLYKFSNKVTVYGRDGKEKSAHDLNNIGNLQSLTVLTGSWTASASEMVINGLMPYMDVFLIGNTTIGKNVGSATFYEEDDSRNKWGVQPIIAKYYNSQGKSDFTSGFTPDFSDPDTWNMPKKELGDIDEALLSVAIRHIMGEALFRGPSTRSAPSPTFLQEIGSSLDNKPWRNQIIIEKKR